MPDPQPGSGNALFTDPKDFKNILVIKLSSLGDIIHALPVAAALKSKFPGVRLTFLVNRQYGDLVEGHPEVDEVLLFDRRIKNSPYGVIGSLFRLIGSLRKRKFDLVIDLQGLLRSALISRFSGGKLVLGLSTAREGSRFFYDFIVQVPDPGIHAVLRYLLVPRFLGWSGKPEFRMVTGEKEVSFIERFLKAEKVRTYLKMIAVQPTARWKTKAWSPENFSRLCNLIQRTGQVQLIFLGSVDDQEKIGQIVALMDVPPVIATGKFNLKQLAAFLRKTDLLITNDSGPMHLAAALNIPVLAIFGATDPGRTGPFGPGHAVITREIPCRPCLKRSCGNRSFPMECLEKITPESVFEKFHELVFG